MQQQAKCTMMQKQLGPRLYLYDMQNKDASESVRSAVHNDLPLCIKVLWACIILITPYQLHTRYQRIYYDRATMGPYSGVGPSLGYIKIQLPRKPI